MFVFLDESEMTSCVGLIEELMLSEDKMGYIDYMLETFIGKDVFKKGWLLREVVKSSGYVEGCFIRDMKLGCVEFSFGNGYVDISWLGLSMGRFYKEWNKMLWNEIVMLDNNKEIGEVYSRYLMEGV